MKNLNDKEMLAEAVQEIEKVAPRHSEVEINVEENRKGFFSTHIRLTTKQKIYFAHKEDQFLKKSFYKAMRAIKSQVKKKKADHHAVKYSLVS
jgi:ribosome-associated translation inhibitor RaiA